MKMFAHSLEQQDVAYVTVRLSHSMLKALRQAMHIPDGEDLVFPRHTVLHYRGFGWYRLVPYTPHDAAVKLKLAMKLIHKFCVQYEQSLRLDRQVQLSHAQGHTTRAFVTDAQAPTHGGRFINQNVQIHQTQGRHDTPDQSHGASSWKLQQLASRFNARRS